MERSTFVIIDQRTSRPYIVYHGDMIWSAVHQALPLYSLGGVEQALRSIEAATNFVGRISTLELPITICVVAWCCWAGALGAAVGVNNRGRRTVVTTHADESVS